jgi:hypothetical protein
MAAYTFSSKLFSSAGAAVSDSPVMVASSPPLTFSIKRAVGDKFGRVFGTKAVAVAANGRVTASTTTLFVLVDAVARATKETIARLDLEFVVPMMLAVTFKVQTQKIKMNYLLLLW